LFRYRGTAKDGGTLEYVFDGGAQNSPIAITKEKAAEIAADFMATFYHVQVGTLETEEFRKTPAPSAFICFSHTIKDRCARSISSFCCRMGRLFSRNSRSACRRTKLQMWLLFLARHSVRPLRLNTGIGAAVLLAVCDCLACCSLRARLRTGPPNYAAVLFVRNRYREISGFPCRDHNFWINPALNANPFQSEPLNRSPRNIIALVIVLEMLKLLALPLSAMLQLRSCAISSWANGRIGGGRYKLSPVDQMEAIRLIQVEKKSQGQVAHIYKVDRSTVSRMMTEVRLKEDLKGGVL
jgi:hypothetical protein